jgi:DNA-binding CsgD family transcriptional regulator
LTEEGNRAGSGEPGDGGTEPPETSDVEAGAPDESSPPGARRGQGAPLSGREREILSLLAAGDSGAQIAEALVLSPETVRTHIRNAMSKLGASSRAQAVALAFQRNQIGDGGSREAAGASSGPSATLTGGWEHTRAALAGGQADATLSALLAGLVSLYDVDGGTVFLADEDGLSLRRAAILGEPDESGNHHHPERVSLGEGPLGRAALERRAQVIQGSGSRGDVRGRSTICAPMISAGRLVGVICLTTRPSRLTGRGELLLLQAFANRVSEILVSPGADQPRRLKETLGRFRASWSTADGG